MNYVIVCLFAGGNKTILGKISVVIPLSRQEVIELVHWEKI